ncbi:alginate O-acetyltransferase complex protein AlgI [Pectinatus brassicae]|uniref:Alginate O-acetyltransferase complex protein AlgI n=1 Tax=Pectinatus brassicae TaxID=862415 RepID=A0A840UQB8_9FIRM|nr:MBOAT family protein [Pectinatus brassicae]MBB5335024.1 alginate O-acetyltransferase complex protein AlgI [Pectinatus brassicae]
MITLGISFYVLLAISYLVDIYRGQIKQGNDVIGFCLYIIFFPKLIFGPLMRYVEFEQQVYGRKYSLRLFSTGVCRLVKGMAKKWIIADTIGLVANQAFAMNNETILPFPLAWLGIISYGLQFYFDFSGYCDMSIGMGYMLGFKLPENFNYPYITKSVREFWRRWHITLADWFKEYVYIPLGGSVVKNKDILIRNVFLIFILLGIWHGLNSTFIVWAIYNFLFTLMEILVEWDKRNIADFYRHIYFFIFVVLSGILFRSESLLLAGRYFVGLIGVGGFDMHYAVQFISAYGIYYIIALLFCLPISRRMNTLLINNVFKSWYTNFVMIIYPVCMLVLFVIALSYLMIGTKISFVYFSF